MSAIVIVLLFLLGLVLIIKGGDFFVDAASWIAEASGVPKFLVDLSDTFRVGRLSESSTPFAEVGSADALTDHVEYEGIYLVAHAVHMTVAAVSLI